MAEGELGFAQTQAILQQVAFHWLRQARGSQCREKQHMATRAAMQSRRFEVVYWAGAQSSTVTRLGKASAGVARTRAGGPELEAVVEPWLRFRMGVAQTGARTRT